MTAVQLLVSIRGRISRKAYWVATIPLTLALVLAWLLAGSYDQSAAMVGNVLGLSVVWPLFAVTAKRWHDRDKSAWWVLIGAVPVLGQVWTLVECGLLKGSSGYNAYGEPAPKLLVLGAPVKTSKREEEATKSTEDKAETARGRLKPEVASLAKMAGLVARAEPGGQQKKFQLIQSYLSEEAGLDQSEVKDALLVAAAARFSRDSMEQFADVVKESVTTLEERAPGEEGEGPKVILDTRLLNRIADLLFDVAMADDSVSDKEELLLTQVSSVFGFVGAGYSSHRRMQGGWTGDATSGIGTGARPAYYAEILGITGQVSADAVRRAYRGLVKQYHPDKVSHLGPVLREAADAEMKKINEAYQYFVRELRM